MLRQPPRSTRTVTLFPRTQLVRSSDCAGPATRGQGAARSGRSGALGRRLARRRDHPVTHPEIRRAAAPRRPLAAKESAMSAVPKTAITREQFEAVIEISRSEEHTSELQSLMRISYAVFCLQK